MPQHQARVFSVADVAATNSYLSSKDGRRPSWMLTGGSVGPTPRRSKPAQPRPQPPPQPTTQGPQVPPPQQVQQPQQPSQPPQQQKTQQTLSVHQPPARPAANVLPSPTPSDEPSPAVSNPHDSPNPTAPATDSQTMDLQGPSPNEVPDLPVTNARFVAEPTLADVRVNRQSMHHGSPNIASPMVAFPGPQLQSPLLRTSTPGSASSPVTSYFPPPVATVPSNGSVLVGSGPRTPHQSPQLQSGIIPGGGLKRKHPHLNVDLVARIEHQRKTIPNDPRLSDGPRLLLLQDACASGDGMFVAIHQLFCNWSLQGQREVVYNVLSSHDRAAIDGGMGILESLLRANSFLSPAILHFCADFVSPLHTTQPEAYIRTGHLITNLHRYHQLLMQNCRNRRRPLLVSEMTGVLHCYSKTLQKLLFTAVRRTLGVLDGPLGVDIEQIFAKDVTANQAQDGSLAHPAPFKELLELESRVQGLVQQYQTIVYRALNETAHREQMARPPAVPVVHRQTSGPGPARIVTSGLQAPPMFGVTPTLSSSWVESPGHLQQNLAAVGHGVRPVQPQIQQQQQPYQHPQPHFQTQMFAPALQNPQRTTPNGITVAGGPIPNTNPSFQHVSVNHSAVLRPQVRQGLHMPQAQMQRAQIHMPPPQATIPNQIQRQILHPGPHHMATATHFGHGATVSRTLPPSSMMHNPTPAVTVSVPNMSALRPASTTPVSPFPSELITPTQLQMPQAHQLSAGRGPPAPSPSAAAALVAQLDKPFFPPKTHVIPLSERPHDQYGETAFKMSLHQALLRSPTRAKRQRTGEGLKPAQERYYQFVRDFAVPPGAIKPQPYLHEFHIDVDDATIAMLTKNTTVPVGGLPTLPICEYFDGSLRFRLKCCRFMADKDVSQTTQSDWVVMDSSWPSNIYVTLTNGNGRTALTPRRQTYNGKDLPIELTEMLVSGRNTIKISVPTVHNRQAGFYHAVAVEIVETLSHKSIHDDIWRNRHEDAAKTREVIKQRLKASNTAGDDDGLAILVEDLSIDLADPFTKRLFNIPARGRGCTHLECFDLQTWLETRESKPPRSCWHSASVGCECPKPGAEPCVPDKWKCPICNGDARPNSLVIDGFLMEVRSELDRQGNDNAKTLLVSADGAWRPVLDDDDDSDSDAGGGGSGGRTSASGAGLLNGRARVPSVQAARIPEVIELLSDDD